MFERFTDAARETVVHASEVVRSRHDSTIEVVHMFIALADEPAIMAAGLDRGRIEALWDGVIAAASTDDGIDSEALAGIGIDVHAVRTATDREFGRGALARIGRRQVRTGSGHLPFSANLKTALGLSLTHAASSHSRDLTPTHLLLGLLDVDDTDLLAVLRAADVSADSVRAAAIGSLGPLGAETPAPSGVPAVRTGLDHLSLQVADVAAAAVFYTAALAPLGITELARHDGVVGFGSDRPFLWLGKAATDGPARELHLAFTAADRRAVYAFRDAAVGAGAEVLHEPRVFRDYHPSYFAAFVRDPDGNNLEAVCHAPTPG